MSDPVFSSSPPVPVVFKPTIWLEAGKDSMKVLLFKPKDQKTYIGR